MRIILKNTVWMTDRADKIFTDQLFPFVIRKPAEIKTEKDLFQAFMKERCRIAGKYGGHIRGLKFEIFCIPGLDYTMRQLNFLDRINNWEIWLPVK